MPAKLFVLPVSRCVLFSDLVKYLNLDVELVYLKPTAGGFGNPEFFEHFPLKKVPAYLETSSNGETSSLTEMVAIAKYLIDKAIAEKIPQVEKAIELGYGSKGTSDFKTHSDIIRWLSFVTSEYVTVTADAMLMTFGLKEKDDELAEKCSKKSLEYFANFASSTLKRQKFLADPNVPTLADFATIMPFYYSLPYGLTEEYKAKYPEVIAWAKAVCSNDFVKESFKDAKL